MGYTINSRNSILDIDPWIGQSHATFRFELRDGVNGRFLGEVHPDRTSNPTLTHDTTRTIKRQINSVLFTPTESAMIDPLRHRIYVYMEIGGQSFPLGRYAFIDDATIVTTAGNKLTTTLVDEMIIVDQELDIGFSPRNTKTPANAPIALGASDILIRRLLENFSFTQIIEPTEFYSIGSWAQGTSRAKVLEDLSLDGDYFSPWFGHDYALHVIRSFDPAGRPPSFDWDDSDKVIRDSIIRVNDLLTAPNRFVVISNRSTLDESSAVYGTYDVPVSAPNSIINRGFIIPKTFSLQIDTAQQAAALAQNIAQRQMIFERVELSTPPDPRHDSYDVIRWSNENWLELSWSLPLVPGAEMRHVMRKAYV